MQRFLSAIHRTVSLVPVFVAPNRAKKPVHCAKTLYPITDGEGTRIYSREATSGPTPQHRPAAQWSMMGAKQGVF